MRLIKYALSAGLLLSAATAVSAFSLFHGQVPITLPAITIGSVTGCTGVSFTSGVPNGVICTPTINMTAGSSAGAVLSVSGANSGGLHLNASNQLVQAAGGTPAGTYSDFSFIVTLAGASNSPLSQPGNVTGTAPPSQTIASISGCSGAVFTAGIANGGVCTIVVTMSNSNSPPFSGSCSITGANSGGFHFPVGSCALQQRGSGTPAGTYTDATIQVSQPGISNSPQTQALNVVGTATTPLVRGRTHIANNTIVADNGQLLRAVAARLDAPCDAGRFRTYWGDINWWRDMRDNGHFNSVRLVSYLGQWGTSCRVLDMPTITSQLDEVVNLASQVGMYVIIDEHSLDAPTDWGKNTTFWNTVATRYANNTNVLYEIKNEPTYDSLAANENSAFSNIRARAPNTTIIVDSFENIIDGQWPGILASQTMSYANAAVGWHPYETTDGNNLINLAQSMGHPTIMTEYSNPGSGVPPTQSFIESLESHNISWFFWCAGYTDAATGVAHGDCAEPLNITWPRDFVVGTNPPPPPTITSISGCDNAGFTSGITNGPICNAVATMSDGSPFAGSWSIVATPSNNGGFMTAPRR